MNYTSFFGETVKNQGQLHLNDDQFRRLMNIIYVEGVIAGFNKIKAKYKGTSEYYKYDMLIFKQSTVLTELTGNQKPQDLLKEMHSFSEN